MFAPPKTVLVRVNLLLNMFLLMEVLLRFCWLFLPLSIGLLGTPITCWIAYRNLSAPLSKANDYLTKRKEKTSASEWFKPTIATRQTHLPRSCVKARRVAACHSQTPNWFESKVFQRVTPPSWRVACGSNCSRKCSQSLSRVRFVGFVEEVLRTSPNLLKCMSWIPLLRLLFWLITANLIPPS